MRADPFLRCSFCLKSSSEVVVMIAGPPTAAICDACVGICADLVWNTLTGRIDMEREYGPFRAAPAPSDRPATASEAA